MSGTSKPYVELRNPRDQPLISKVAEHFLPTKERNILSKALGKSPGELQFTQSEWKFRNQEFQANFSIQSSV